VKALAFVMLAGVAASVQVQAQAQAQTQCRGETGQYTTALVELYTSEGCDSCPPADKVISQLKATGNAIPMAWHVDYWDRLGWKDRFGRADAAVRQRALVAVQGERTVYTPQWIANGKTIRPGGSAASVLQAVAPLQQQPPGARLRLSHGTFAHGTLAVELAGDAPPGAQVFIALLEDGLSSQVSAGENKGVLLKHDHVVREVAGPLALRAQFTAQTHPVNVPQDAQLSKLRVVAWVQDASGKVLNSAVASCTKG
jgi:hypothetical protein